MHDITNHMSDVDLGDDSKKRTFLSVTLNLIETVFFASSCCYLDRYCAFIIIVYVDRIVCFIVVALTK